MHKILLNCDLGEWESSDQTRALMQYLDLANIACGGHAGSIETISYCHRIAQDFGVKTGAHPGLPDGGRGDAGKLTCEEFETLLNTQIETYLSCGAKLHHIKLHGSLYHLSESRPDIRDAYLNFATQQNCAIVCLAGGQVAYHAQSRNITVLPEAFLDRSYQADGSLIPRDQSNATISDIDLITQRLDQLTTGQPITAADGSLINVIAKTVCVHSDSKNSLTILKTAHNHLNAG